MFSFSRPCILLLAAAGARAAALSPEQADFFESKIRPVLASECYGCHNEKKQKGGLRLDYRDGWQRGGESGDAIVAGDPGQSLLLKAIRHEDPDLKMPAKAPKLDEEIIANFEKWIQMGAPDPRDNPPAALEVAGSWTDLLAARRNWWALLPVESQAIPKVRNSLWSAHPVDRFLLAKLEQKELPPAQPADARTLIRRLTFVLTGLPPAPAEVEMFLSDSANDRQAALQKATVRLLASPRFGEHWARHWMDLVRYAETHGSEGDPEIPEAWRYRDYLVRAFNADLPYDALVREHLAGDLLPIPRLNPAGFNESILGTAHLRLVEHGFQPVDTLDDQVKAVDSQIDVVSKTFQALTISCARCHDHKFDAISQRDYYALYGIFASCRPAQVIIDSAAVLNKGRDALEKLHAEIKTALAEEWTASASTLAKRLLEASGRASKIAANSSRIGELDRRVSTLEQAARAGMSKLDAPAGPAPVALWNFASDAGDAIGSLGGHLYGGAELKNGRLILNGSSAYLQTEPLAKTLHAKTLEAWLAIADLDQSGGGVLGLESMKDHGFDSIVYSEREPRRWMAGSEFYVRSQNATGKVENALPAELTQIAIVYAEDGGIALYRNGAPYGSSFKQAPMRVFEADDARVLIGLRHAGAKNGFFKGEIEEARLYDRALSASEVEASFRAGTPPLITSEQLIAALTPDQLAEHHAFKLESTQLRSELLALTGTPDPLQKALGEANSPFRRWLVMQKQAEFAEAWQKLVKEERAALEEARQSNREQFRPMWDLAGGKEWFHEGFGLGAAARGPGEFSIEREGDVILSGIRPAGVLTSRLSDKNGGLLVSPRFKIDSDSISIRAFGGGGAMARVIVDNYPLSDNPVFPKAVLEKGEPGWIRLDTAYRRGNWAYIELGTREDLTRPLSAKKPGAEGRSYFGIGAVVSSDGKTAPIEENVAPLALFEGDEPRSIDALAALYQSALLASIKAWSEDRLDEPRRTFLDYFVRRGVLPTTLSSSEKLKPLVESYRQIEAAIPIARHAPGVIETTGFDSPLLPRGDHLKPGETVPRRFLEVLGSQPYRTPLSGRMELAEELANPRNPLTARVMVNRIWQWIFGRGLVATVDNFGRMGEKATHAELLDFLAAHFIEHGWSIKEMAGFLVSSRAFQMSSEASAVALETDPANTWLSHMRLRRIEAEAIRDALLAVSGELDLAMEGPGEAPGSARRSIYLQIRRTNLNPFLQVFDAPQPFTTLGRRDSTNVPAQSLAMLNSPFVIERSRAWARSLRPELGMEGRIVRMFESALSRPPNHDELAGSIAYLEKLVHGVAGEKVDERAWQDLAQSLFNLKEFIYVR